MKKRSSAPSHSTFKRTLLVLVSLAGTAALLYGNILTAPFIYDDINHITRNPHIRMTALPPSGMPNLFKSPAANRPLANLTLAVNYYFHRFDVRGYHVFNLLIHICTAFLVYQITRQTLFLSHHRRFRDLPWLTALLWLVHPLHVQSVTYTIQRMNSLAALFCLLALTCYIRARQTQWQQPSATTRTRLLFAASVVAALAGLASKEIAASLPALILAYEWFSISQNDSRRWQSTYYVIMALVAVVIASVALIYMEFSPWEKILTTYEKHNFTLSQRLLTEPRVILYYLSLISFPHPDRLALLYDFPLSTSLFAPLTTLPALTALVAAIFWALSAARKQPLLSFAAIWFLLALVIESSVIGLALVFEHRTYLPSVFLLIAIAWLARRFIKPPALAVGLLVTAIIICGFWTWQRNQAWTNRPGFWQDNAAKFPFIAEVRNNWGEALLDIGQTDSARSQFQQALRIDSEIPSARLNLGVILEKEGRTETAMAHYRQVLKAHPAHIQARFNLAMALHQAGRLETSIDHLKIIMKQDPSCSAAAYKLGLLHREAGRPRQSLLWLRRAVRLNPDDAKTYNSLGVVLREQGKSAQALELLEQGLRSAGPDPHLYNTLGLVQMDIAHYDRAAALFQRSIQQAPANRALRATAWNNLGLTTEKKGQIEEARQYYRRALAVKPGYAPARRNLGRLLLTCGHPDQAVPLLRQAAQEQPDDATLSHWLAMALAATDQDDEAVAVLESAAARNPDTAAIPYNLACLYARLWQTETALRRLQTALNNGYDNWEQIKTDPDLTNLRATKQFRQWMRTINPPSADTGK